MKKNWWKVTGALIVLFVIIKGLTTPLRPGLLVDFSENTLKVGHNEVIIKGFNTRFSKVNKEELSVWLESGDAKICGIINKQDIVSNTQLNFSIDIPEQLPHKSLGLYVSNNTDQATLYLPDAFHVNDIKEGTLENSCSPMVYTNSYQGFPYIPILYESIRNLFFHVPMWFAMMTIMLISMVYSIMYLRKFDIKKDIVASEAVNVGLIFTVLGLITGSIWARFTWGTWWTSDPQLNGAAAVALIYFAYTILRNAVDDEEKRARIAAIYNIFAFAMLIVFIRIIPQLSASLHPGSGGNQGFGNLDMNNELKRVFYPAALGWIIISVWLLTIKVRIKRLEEKTLEEL